MENVKLKYGWGPTLRYIKQQLKTPNLSIYKKIEFHQQWIYCYQFYKK